MANQSSNLNVKSDIEQLNNLIAALNSTEEHINELKASISGFNSTSFSFKTAVTDINSFNNKVATMDKRLSSLDNLQKKFADTEKKISDLTTKMGLNILELIDIIGDFKTASTGLGSISMPKGGGRGGSSSSQSNGANQAANKTLDEYVSGLEKTLALKKDITYATEQDLQALTQLVERAKNLQANLGGGASAEGLPKVATPKQIDSNVNSEALKSSQKLLQAHRAENEEVQRNKVLLADRNKTLRQTAVDTLNASKVEDENYNALTRENIEIEKNRQSLALRSKTIKEVAKYELILADAMERIEAIQLKLSQSTNLTKTEQTNLKNELKDLTNVAKVAQSELTNLNSAQGAAGASTRKFNAAQWNLVQVIREIPNFAISARVGLMSLSNNLPMLAESFMRAGKMAAFFQRNVIAINIGLVVLTTLLMQLPAIINWFKGLSLGELGKSIREVSKDLEESKSKIIEVGAKVVDIMGKLRAAEAFDSNKTMALKAYNKEFGNLFGTANSVGEAMDILNKKTNAYFATLVLGELRAKLSAEMMKKYGNELVKNISKTLGGSVDALDTYTKQVTKSYTAWNKFQKESLGFDKKKAGVENLISMAQVHKVSTEEVIAVENERKITLGELFKQMRAGTITQENFDRVLNRLSDAVAVSTGKTILAKDGWKAFNMELGLTDTILAKIAERIGADYGLNLGGDKNDEKVKKQAETISSISASFERVTVSANKYDHLMADLVAKSNDLKYAMSEENVITGEINSIESRLKAWEDYYENRNLMREQEQAMMRKDAQIEYNETKKSLDNADKANKARWKRAQQDYAKAQGIYAKDSSLLEGDEIAKYTEAMDEATKSFNKIRVDLFGGINEDGVAIIGAMKDNANARRQLEENHFLEMRKINNAYIDWKIDDYYQKLIDYAKISEQAVSEVTYNEKKKLNDRLVALELDLAKELQDISTKSQSAISDIISRGATGKSSEMASLSIRLKTILAEQEAFEESANAKIASNDKIIASEEEAIEVLRKKAQEAIFSQKEIANANEYDATRMKEANERTQTILEGAIRKHTNKIADLRKESAEQTTEVLKNSAKTQLEIEKEMAEAMANQIANTMKSIIDMVDSLVENAIERERQLLSAWEEENSTRIDQQLKSKVISEEQAEAQREALENEKRKREHEIALREDKYKKDRALFDIGIATAVGIMNAWASASKFGVAGIAFASILTGLISGAAIAQTVAVMSKPSPAFEHGVVGYDPHDYIPIYGRNKALVGENGAEMKIGKGGDISLITKPSIIDMKKGDSIIPNYDTQMAMMLLGLSGSDFSDKQIVKEQKRTNSLLMKISNKRNTVRRINYNHFWS